MTQVERLLQRIKRGAKPPAIDSRDKGEAGLLDTPQAKLKRPLLIESAHVGDTFYLVANEGQAREIEKSGRVCYLPGEIRSILATSAGMDGENRKCYLKSLHETKKTFRGARILALDAEKNR
jgi:hypothetical protein